MQSISVISGKSQAGITQTSDAEQLTKYDFIRYVSIYLMTWFVAYYEVSIAGSFAVLVVLMLFQLRSYQDCTYIMLLAIFIPYIGDLFGTGGISGLKPTRLIFIPFLYYSLRIKPKRKLRMNKSMFFLFAISIISLKITADIQNFVQDAPLSAGQTESISVKNIIASYYDMVVIAGFLYFVYTRLSFIQVSKLFNILLLFALLEAFCLLFLVYKNPSMVFDVDTFARGGELGDFDVMYLWRNKYFGHKNDWGMMMVFVLYAAVTRLFVHKSQKIFYTMIIVTTFAAILISLSRQAVVWTMLGALIIMISKRNAKFNMGFVAVVALILITQPAFLMDRMNSMFTASSSEDFQALNRKVSDQAINQVVSNFQIVPRMFFVDWEYNYSEGFWNGMLHQQGILGFLFHFLLYAFIFFRFLKFYRTKNAKMGEFGLLGLMFTFFMFFACFNRRSTHLLHYEGDFTQINFLVLFIFIYIELISYAYKNRIINYQRL